MALLDWMSPDSGLTLNGAVVRLRPPRLRDYEEWAVLRRRSQQFLQPWEPTWPADDLTKAAFRRRLAAYARELDLGAAYPFFVFRTEDEALVGGVTLSNVRRGVAQMATLGYWAGQPFARRGYTHAAVKQLSAYAFHTFGLHRIEAACVPENERSHGLLLKAGFLPEGRAPAYLKINGEWRDHLLFGMVSDAAERQQPG
jgi:ribosomal-protein-alanine N-acetyltransferase